jgi:hypothetical protein
MGIIRKGGKASKSAKQTIRYWGIQPADPVITSVVRVGVSYLSGDYDVYFTPGTGIGSTASSYTITASNATYGDRTFTATTSPYRVTGLRSGASWTFKIKANATIGQSNTTVTSTEVSGGSQNVTGLPGKPSAPSASSPSNVSYDTISWSAPENGGSAIIDYQWESNDGKSGTVSGTSTNVNQEGGTAQAYRVRARNTDGYGEWSDYSSTTTTFSFVPFSVFGFSPFGVFGFSPFGVFGFSPFGFSPFGVFGFSPFGVFGFSPFGFSPFGVFGFSPFGFSPFGVFGFSPFSFGGCVDENTLISVVTETGGYGTKPASEVQPGDEVWGVVWAEYLDEGFDSSLEWSSPTITNLEIRKTKVISKTPQPKTVTMTINGEVSKKFSLNQPVLTKRNGAYMYVLSGSLEPGDYVLEYSYEHDAFSEVLIQTVQQIEGDANTFRFDCEDADTFLAGNLVMHNMKYY